MGVNAYEMTYFGFCILRSCFLFDVNKSSTYLIFIVFFIVLTSPLQQSLKHHSVVNKISSTRIEFFCLCPEVAAL